MTRGQIKRLKDENPVVVLPERKRWEYLVARYSPLADGDFVAWLDRQGSEGWELIIEDVRTYTFKREAQ